VFFDGARIPDTWRLGPEREGWRVAVTTLMNERVAMSGAGSVLGDVASGSPVTRLIERHSPVADPQLRQRLARAYVDERVIALNNKRAADKRRSGLDAGPEGSITKLQSAEANQRMHHIALDLEGPTGIAWEGRPLVHDAGAVFAVGDETSRGAARAFLRSRANTIEGGTSEIMRNILGERVLGLPKEPDPFHGAPWRDVPRND
jgi:alkylation response protein AidB-like acyl-CoA dehydrogenase